MLSCDNADVVVLHLGENDCERISAKSAAEEIYQLALVLIQSYIVKLFKFFVY